MKKTIVLGAVLAAFGGAAVAQSSVTLFGVVDANVRYVKTGSTNLKQVGTDGLSASRLGVRGTEDLGGGLKAGFWLEAALNPDTGAADGSRFWGRRATVSLSAADMGEVRIGRHKVAARLVIDGFSPFETTGIADITKSFDDFGAKADTLNRSDNQVAYVLPDNLGGVYGGIEAGAGEGADGKKYYSGRIGYKTKELNVAGGYASTNVVGDKYKLAVVGASYDFGVATGMATYVTTKLGSLERKVFTLGAIVPVSNEGSIRAHYANSNANSAAEVAKKGYDLTIFSVGYVHNVSKRTALYTTYSQIANKDGGTVVIGNAGNNAPKAAAGDKSSAFEVGVRHSF